jgi:flagellar protein FliS
MIPQGYKQYQRNQTETASPGELIVLLYGGAIRFLTVARQRLDAGDLEGSHRNLLRAQEIILELMISVDVSVGPVAQSLFDLYEFMHRRLVEANVKKDGQRIDDVVGLLRELLPSWEQAIASSQKGQAAPAKIAAVA